MVKKLRLFQHFSKLQPKQKWIFLLNLFLPRICVFSLSESCFSTKNICVFFLHTFPPIWGGRGNPFWDPKRVPVRQPGRGCPIATAFGEVATTGLMAERGEGPEDPKV